MEAIPPRQSQSLTLIIGALFGVLALLTYLFLGSRNETLAVQKVLTTKAEQLAATQVRLDSVRQVLDDKIRQVRALGGSVKQLERIRLQLQRDRQKLNYDLNFSLQRYDRKIREYNQFLAVQETNIETLKRENRSLAERARSLEEEKESFRRENEGLRSERSALAQSLNDYSRQNADLKQKVTQAAALKAVNLETAAVSANGRERTGGVYRATRLDQLRIRFTLLANPLSLRDEKDIYVRVLDPQGAVISENSQGGVFRHEGVELGFSTREAVLYENNDQSVTISLRRDAPYNPGVHRIELYAEGFRIGEGEFTIR